MYPVGDVYRLEKEGAILRNEKVTNNASYAANQALEIDLIQGRNITLLRGTLVINYSVPGAGAGPTSPVEDGWCKLVSNMQIQYGGGTGNPINTLGLQQLHVYGQHLYGGSLRQDQPTALAAGASATAYVDFIISPTLFPYNPTVPMFLLPGEAPNINNMKLTGDWTNLSNVFGTTNDVQIDSATLSVTEEIGWVFGPRTNVMRNALGVDNSGYVPMPIYTKGTEQFSGSISDLGAALDTFPTNRVIRRLLLIAKDSTGARSNDIITTFAVNRPDNTNILGELDFEAFQRRKAEQLGISRETGCIMIDFARDVRSPDHGNKTDGLYISSQNDLDFSYGTSAQGSIDFLFDTVQQSLVFSPR